MADCEKAEHASASHVMFEESEIGFADMAEGWESCVSVRTRFRRSLPWLQFPIPCRGEAEDQDDKASDEKKNPHAPSTRALELNWEILSSMLGSYGGEFLDIDRLTKEAGWVAMLRTRGSFLIIVAHFR